MQVPIYLVVKKTGQFDEDGRELTIVFDVKLNRAVADVVAAHNPGTEVIKMIADKEVSD